MALLPPRSTLFPYTTLFRSDVFARYRVRIAEMRQSVKICQQAIKRVTPSGVWACDDTRVVPPPKDKVYTEMEALIQRSEEHTSELQSQSNLVCRLLHAK